MFEELEPRHLCSNWTPVHAPGVESYKTARSGHQITLTVKAPPAVFTVVDREGQPLGVLHQIGRYKFRLTFVEPLVGGVHLNWSSGQHYEILFAPLKDNSTPRAPG